MIGGLGTTELIIILVIVMILFGAGRLPEVGAALGKGIRNFRKATRGEDERDVTPTPPSEAQAQTQQPQSIPEGSAAPGPTPSSASVESTGTKAEGSA